MGASLPQRGHGYVGRGELGGIFGYSMASALATATSASQSRQKRGQWAFMRVSLPRDGKPCPVCPAPRRAGGILTRQTAHARECRVEADGTHYGGTHGNTCGDF